MENRGRIRGQGIQRSHNRGGITPGQSSLVQGSARQGRDKDREKDKPDDRTGKDRADRALDGTRLGRTVQGREKKGRVWKCRV